MSPTPKQDWIDDLEIPDAQIKWPFSNFDGRVTMFNTSGERNFNIIIPESEVDRLEADGWSIRRLEGFEEGDPPEYLLKVKISYKYEPPKIFLIKGNRKFRAEERDLSDISRATCERIDVIITPSRWVHGQNSGISAYVKELYATVKESRFEAAYADYEEV